MAERRRPAPQPRPRGTRLVLGAALLAAAAIVAWWMLRPDRDEPRALPSATVAPAATGTPAAARARAPSGERVIDEAGGVVAQRIDGPGDALPRAPEHIRATLEDYRKANRFPPTSQPLFAHNTDLMQPNQRYEQPLPSQHDPEVTYVYSGVKNTIVGDEPIETYLQVSRAGKPIDVAIVAGEARVEALGVSIPLTYTRDGDRYVNRLSSAALGISKVAVVETEVWFEASAGLEESREIPFFYTPAAAIPARFTGEFRDAIEDGSLAIYATIDVALEGHYVLDCNLYGPGGEPVMFSRFKDPLPRGRSEVRLLFFGKALREVGVAPPYHLGQLRGARFVLGADPDTEPMPLVDWTYTTRTEFTLDDLSDAEWSDPHKDQMIQYLEEQLAAAEGRGGG